MKKPNLFDGAVALAVVLCLAFVGYTKFYKNKAKGKGECTKIEFKVELKSKEGFFCDLISPGDIVVISEKERDEAVLKKIESQEAQRVQFDQLNEKYILSKIPDKYDIVLTMEGEALETNDDFKIGDTSIKTGATIFVKSKTYAGYGYVLDLNRL